MQTQKVQPVEKIHCRSNKQIVLNTDIAIIGGGASGLAAAIEAKRTRPDFDVLIVEKKECTGKKLRATGNGRCNVSNTACSQFKQVEKWFASVGIETRTDESGRVYPYSEDASDVTQELTQICVQLGVKILLNTCITGMEADREGGFLLLADDGKTCGPLIDDGKTCRSLADIGNSSDLFTDAIKSSGSAADAVIPEGVVSICAKRVLLATGGKSYASLGTSGDGYVLARKLGHTVTQLAPALTGVEIVENLKALKGVRSKAETSLFYDGKKLVSEYGEIQFRQDGISGICIMNLSRYIRPEFSLQRKSTESMQGRESAETFRKKMTKAFGRYEIHINFMPEFTKTEIEERLAERKKRLSIAEGQEKMILQTIVKAPVASEILKRCGADTTKLAEELSAFKLTVSGLKGWNEAQVTAGGVADSEIKEETMESVIIPNLYFSGEITEYAGPCGGFNLHHAWLTGIRAGRAMAESL